MLFFLLIPLVLCVETNIRFGAAAKERISVASLPPSHRVPRNSIVDSCASGNLSTTLQSTHGWDPIRTKVRLRRAASDEGPLPDCVVYWCGSPGGGAHEMRAVASLAEGEAADQFSWSQTILCFVPGEVEGTPVEQATVTCLRLPPFSTEIEVTPRCTEPTIVAHPRQRLTLTSDFPRPLSLTIAANVLAEDAVAPSPGDPSRSTLSLAPGQSFSDTLPQGIVVEVREKAKGRVAPGDPPGKLLGVTQVSREERAFTVSAHGVVSYTVAHATVLIHSRVSVPTAVIWQGLGAADEAVQLVLLPGELWLRRAPVGHGLSFATGVPTTVADASAWQGNTHTVFATVDIGTAAPRQIFIDERGGQLTVQVDERRAAEVTAVVAVAGDMALPTSFGTQGLDLVATLVEQESVRGLERDRAGGVGAAHTVAVSVGSLVAGRVHVFSLPPAPPPGTALAVSLTHAATPTLLAVLSPLDRSPTSVTVAPGAVIELVMGRTCLSRVQVSPALTAAASSPLDIRLLADESVRVAGGEVGDLVVLGCGVDEASPQPSGAPDTFAVRNALDDLAPSVTTVSLFVCLFLALVVACYYRRALQRLHTASSLPLYAPARTKSPFFGNSFKEN